MCRTCRGRHGCSCIFGATEEEYYEHIRRVLEFKPHIIIDDGGEFVTMLTEQHPEYAECLIGGCEETTTGIHKLRARAKDGSLPFPMLAVNDADCKHLLTTATARGKAFGTESCTRQTTW